MNQKSAITVEAEALALVKQFGDGVGAMFEQLVKGNWVDDHGHPVKNNTAMISLKMPMMNLMSLRGRVEAAPVAPAQGRTFKITIAGVEASDQYDLVGFCVSVVAAFGMTEPEVAAVVALQVGETFTNEDMTVRRVA